MKQVTAVFFFSNVALIIPGNNVLGSAKSLRFGDNGLEMWVNDGDSFITCKLKNSKFAVPLSSLSHFIIGEEDNATTSKA